MRGSVALLAASTLSLWACYSSEDLLQRPVDWTVMYPAAAWKEMTSCIGMGMSGEWRVTPDYFPGELRARLNLGAQNVGFQIAWSVYDIRQVEGGTEVTWRRIPKVVDIAGETGRAREVADRCGRQT